MIFFLATQPTGDCFLKKEEKKFKNFFISASTRGETGGQQQVSALFGERETFHFAMSCLLMG